MDGRSGVDGPEPTGDATGMIGRPALGFAAFVVASGTMMAARPASPTRVSPQALDAGIELARLIHPASVNSAIVSYTFVNVVGPTYRADPNLKMLEAAHPGIIEAIIAPIRPKFEQGRTRVLPALWKKTGALYARELDMAELRQAVAFYGSPTGRRLVDFEARAIIHAGPPGKPSADILASAPNPASPDVAAKSAFDATPAGRRLAALEPEAAAIDAAWNNAPAPEGDARTNAALAEVMSRFGVSDSRAEQ